ncbi:MAG: CatA-like O-acetyltransferase [Candidatus Rifleibacteriota bacterium]
MKLINIENWNRKDHYHFFSQMKSPFFGITAEVNCTGAYQKAKEENISFFAYYLHRSTMAINRIKEFKYRIIDDKVYELDTIHAGATISRSDGTFAFIYVDYDEDFDVFNKSLKNEIEKVKNTTGLNLSDDDDKIKDIIHYTTVPWISFTAILHPTNFDRKESVPKIAFGKFYQKEGQKLMPVSVEAHHGLMDAYHMSEYFKEFEKLLK